MICQRCNTNNPDYARFCMKCQAPMMQPQYSAPTAQLSRNNRLICPNCGAELPLNVRKCNRCKTQFNAPIEIHQQQTMKPCYVCGNLVSKTADICPYCGNNNLKKVAQPILLDIIAVFAIAIAVFAYTMGEWVFSYGVILVVMIIYCLYYNSIKNNPEIDSSKVKQSLTVITIVFIFLFCLSFTITFV